MGDWAENGGFHRRHPECWSGTWHWTTVTRYFEYPRYILVDVYHITDRNDLSFGKYIEQGPFVLEKLTIRLSTRLYPTQGF
jgi:hypothetical protein